MATVFREQNQVKWIGVRPGHNGEQAFGINNCVNVRAVVYTVPADKIFLWTGYAATMSGTVTGNGDIEMWSAAPALTRVFISMYYQIGTSFGLTNDFSIPIELIAGESIRIISSAATNPLYCSAWGILIDA